MSTVPVRALESEFLGMLNVTEPLLFREGHGGLGGPGRIVHDLRGSAVGVLLSGDPDGDVRPPGRDMLLVAGESL